MKRIFTTLLLSVGISSLVMGQLSSTSYKNTFNGTLTGVGWPGTNYTDPLMDPSLSSTRIFPFGNYTISDPSINSMTITGALATDAHWINLMFGGSSPFDLSGPYIDISKTPFIRVTVTNLSGDNYPLDLRIKNGNGCSLVSGTVPVPVGTTQNLVYNCSVAGTSIAGVEFRTNTTFSGTVVLDDLYIGIIAGTISSINSIAGNNSVSAGSVNYYSEIPSPGRTDYKLGWSVSDPSLATIDGVGKLTAGGYGGVLTITATAIQGSTTVLGMKEITIVGYGLATGITPISGASTITTPGKAELYTSAVTPANALPTITWSVSPSGFASIYPNGSLVAIKDGVVTITATSVANTSFTATKVVTISNQTTPKNGYGYFYDNFTTTTVAGSVLDYFALGGTDKLTISGFNTGTGEFTVKSSATVLSVAGGSGLENSLGFSFNRRTNGEFNQEDIVVSFTAYSSQQVQVTFFIVNTTTGLFNTPRIGQTVTLNEGAATYTVNFGNLTPSVVFTDDVALYMVYNYPFATGYTVKPAGTLVFNSLSIGTKATGLSISSDKNGEINSLAGNVALSFSAQPSYISQKANLTITSSFDNNKIVYDAFTNTVTGSSGLVNYYSSGSTLVANQTGNGTVTISGTTLTYPYVASSYVVTVTNNLIIDPTEVLVSPSDISLGKEETSTFTASTIPANATYYTIKWLSSNPSIASITSLGGVSISNTAVNGDVVTITAFAYRAGIYTVSGSALITVTVTSVTTTPGTTTGIDNSLANQITVYPNPATDVINISSDVAISSVSLINATGKIIASYTENTSVISLVGISKGLYILSIQTPNGTIRKRLSIE